MHKYKYDIVNRDFKAKNTLYILGYFDTSLEEVVYRPLDKLLYSFLKSINKTESLKVHLRLFLKKNKISYKNYAEVFENILKELSEKKVLI